MNRFHQIPRRLIVAVALVAAGAHFTIAAERDDFPDVRRVLLRPEQLPAELERVRRGVLRQMPLTDFDALIARAANAGAALRDPPRLLQANYRASLSGEALIGSCTWSILHRRSTPGLMSAEPLNLAVRSANWDDGSPALLGELDTRPQAPGLELLVGRPGEQRLNMDWSARGVPEPAGLRFDLRVPTCPAAVLDIDLPGDQEPVIPHDGGLLTGPLPSTIADRKLWRLAFAGSSQIDLIVRPMAERPAPLVLAGQHTRQDVSPGQTDSEFTFDLEAPNGGVRDLILECDPGLRPAEVTARNLERWAVHAATAAKELTRVEIHLREPMRSGSVTLRAIGPAPLNRPWVSPAAAMVGAIPRGENLTLRIHPDLQLSDWRPGPFRLIDSIVTPDRWQVLNLQSGLIRNGPGRPSGSLRPAEADYRVRERLWWLATADRMTLTAKLAVEVSRGPVFQIPLQLPAGWNVDRVEADPADLLASATRDGPRLLIELNKALATGAAANLIVELARRPPRGELPSEPIPLPDLVPIGARGREGTFAVRIGPGLQSATVDTTAPAPKMPVDGDMAPWGDASPDYVFPLHAGPSMAEIRIWPRPTQVRARAETTVTVSGNQADLVCRLRLEPAIGSADAVLLQITGASSAWAWEVVQGNNRVRSVQPLTIPPRQIMAGLAARTPLAALAAIGVPSDQQTSWWRVALARPLNEPIELEAHAVVPLIGPTIGRAGATIPLVYLPGALDASHRVTVDLRSASAWEAVPVGLTELPLADGSTRFRSFRYEPASASLRLAPDHGESTPIQDRAFLVTYATEPDRLVHHLSFRLWNWRRAMVPVDLPPDAVVKQLRVDGILANPASAALEATAFHVDAPASAGTRNLTIDIVYSTHGASGGFLRHIGSPAPVLPIGGGIRRVWCLPYDTVPLNADTWRALPAADLAIAEGKPEESQPDEAEIPDSPATGTRRSLANVSGMLPADLARGRFWESADDVATEAAPWIVRPRQAQLIGVLLAVGFLALAWAARSRAIRRRWAGTLAFLTAVAAAAIWLPAPLAAAARWPLFAGVLSALWQLLPARLRMHRSKVVGPKSSAAVPVLTAVLLAAIWLGSTGRAAAPGPTTVYVVPGVDAAAAPTTILVPPDLLDRLQAQARRAPFGQDAAEWTSARYDGRIAGSQARFTAVLRLHAFGDDPPPILLPLTGVQLGDAKLDGAAAFPRTAGDRYLVPVHGRGPHSLEVSFSVSCGTSGDDREMRFGIPEIANSSLTFTGPATATQLQPMLWRGSQRMDADHDRPRLDVDLGRVGAIDVRWRIAGSNPRPATVQTQETYLWDLTESAARLLGAVRFTIGPGSVTALDFALPNRLEVAAVTARPMDVPAGAIPAGWLRSWHINPAAPGENRRLLNLEFAVPIDGRWQVNLELVPREPFAAAFTLPFPSAVGIRSSPPVFGWRHSVADVNVATDLTDVAPNGATLVAPEAFLRDNWLPAKVEADPRPPTRAYQRAAPGPIPSLRLKATVRSHEHADADIVWRVGPRRAEVEATARFSEPAGKVSLSEWIVPANVEVSEVRGSDIHAWSRSGARLQVWLNAPAAESVVHITGSIPRSTPTARFDVPPIRPRAIATGTVRVMAREGLELVPVQAVNLSAATGKSDSGERRYTIDRPQPYVLTFDVRKTASTPVAKPPVDKGPGVSPVPRTAQVRIELADVAVARGDDGRWIARESLWLTQSVATDLAVTWPAPVRMFAIGLDGQSMPTPSAAVATVSVPSPAGTHRLQLIWAVGEGNLPPKRPETPNVSANGEMAPASPMLWTVLAPASFSPAPDVAPLPPAVASLYRAAAHLRLADAARAAGDTAKAERARAAAELRLADAGLSDIANLPAGPGGITLAAWRQQIRDGLRSGGTATGEIETAEVMPYDDAFSHGVPFVWRVAAGDDGPRLSWRGIHSAWRVRSLRTVAIALAGLIGVWRGRRMGFAAWPELLTLLGCANWVADGGAYWLVLAAAGIGGRLILSAEIAIKRFWPRVAAHQVNAANGS